MLIQHAPKHPKLAVHMARAGGAPRITNPNTDGSLPDRVTIDGTSYTPEGRDWFGFSTRAAASLVGGGVGAIPGVGVLTNILGGLGHPERHDVSRCVLGVGGAISNVATSALIYYCDISPAWMALSGVTGGLAWATYLNDLARNP